jgi:regulator of protease activity HflC (stomatin/prohibitin superfamily)
VALRDGGFRVLIGFGDAASVYSGSGGGGYEINGADQLTLAPTLQAGWTGPGYFPGGPAGVQFTMTTNYGESRPGTLTSTTPAAYPIDAQFAPGTRWLGHTMVITVTIDPDNVVAESNESNNTATRRRLCGGITRGVGSNSAVHGSTDRQAGGAVGETLHIGQLAASLRVVLGAFPIASAIVCSDAAAGRMASRPPGWNVPAATRSSHPRATTRRNPPPRFRARVDRPNPRYDVKQSGPAEVVMLIGILLGALGVSIAWLASSARVIKQYERGLVFRFGRVMPEVRGPGLTVITPGIDRLRKVNMQIITLPVPAQDGITKDNVTVKVDAVVYFNVSDPVQAVVKVQDYQYAVAQVAQTSLRSMIGKSELDDLLSNRERLNEGLEVMIDSPALEWGIHIDRVEIKDVALPDSMKRSMSRQAEAERERRARVITADGELQASEKLAEAANKMAATPTALQLRLLQTVVEVAAEKNSTLVLPFPVELLRFLEAQTIHINAAQTAEVVGQSRVDDLLLVLRELLGVGEPQATAVDSAAAVPSIRGIEAAEASPTPPPSQASGEEPSPAAEPVEAG